MAVFTEFNIDQGTSYISVISVTDDLTGAPINLASYNVSSQLRKSYYSEQASADFICSVVDSANGNLSIALPSTITRNLEPGRYVTDVVIDNGTGTVIRVVEGIVTINPGVSR